MVWRMRYKQKVMMKPLKALVPKFQAHNLMSKAFKTLMERKKLQKLKRSMNFTAEQYFRQTILKKGMIALLQSAFKPASPEHP
mmetsp:Transcript_4398/g.6389  ORF Transcript_4398/g.6389 Transcript_4398/m.6389 type:complete len:83 (+) Transcript_4398:4202-4450(+)